MTAERPPLPLSASERPASVENALRICRVSPSPAFLVTGGARVLFGNAALARGLGTARAEGGPAASVLGTERWSRAAPVIEILFAGKAPAGMTLDLGDLAFRAVPIIEDGRVHAVFATAEPAADHNEEAARTVAAETLRVEVERVTAAKARFLASASHDLRQPFQAMRLFLESLMAQLTDDRARDTAGMLGSALEAGEKLLNALLDMSTLDAGTVKPNRRVVALDQLLRRLADEMRPQAEEKGLKLKARLRPAMADTDPVLLERIVRNLLSNAVRYTRHGAILLALRPRRGRLRIEVWDTGFGIPKDQTDAIFDEFHQLENPSRDPNRGLGLGLAIVKRVATLIGTPVEVRSQLGRGTVFAVTVPAGAVVAPEPAEPTPAEPEVNLAGTTVLVIDDDPMVLAGLEMGLDSWGCTVVSASDMRDVFAKLDPLPTPPDIILSDLRLRGGLSGFEVIERVRRLYGKPIPAVVLTGETGQDELQEGRRRGCAFLHKPLHPAELRQTLGRLLDAAAAVRKS